MIRIFVNEFGAVGGVERLVLALSRELHAQGRAHEIGCFRDSVDLASHADWPVRIRALDPPRSLRAEAKALRRFLSEAGPTPLVFDLTGAVAAGLGGARGFHLHLTDPPSLLGRDITKYALSMRHLRPAGSRPSVRQQLRGEVVHRLARRGVRGAASVIVMTNRIAGEIDARYGRVPTIIRPGVHAVGRSAPRVREPYELLSVCRLEAGKRLEWIVEALATLAPRDPRWRATLIGGGGHGPALQQVAARRGVADRIAVPGRVPDAALASAYDEAGMFVMPAEQGYGLPALEALERSLPVVMHRGSGVSEILEGSPWVEIIEGLDPAALTGGIERLATRMAEGRVLASERPNYPTEDAWARSIARHCGWSS